VVRLTCSISSSVQTAHTICISVSSSGARPVHLCCLQSTSICAITRPSSSHMWVHHGATLYCLLSLDLDYPHCALIACLELQCQSFFHCSYDFCRLGCEGGHIIVVANSTFKIRPVLKDLRSAREIARKGVSKIQIRYIYLDDANPVILSPAKRPRIFFSHHEAS
jgi:hypothetical protein